MSTRVKEPMTTTALERVRGLLAKPHLSMTEVEEILGILETDEFDALVRDAELWRKHQPALKAANSILDAARPLVLNVLRIEDAIDDERGGG